MTWMGVVRNIEYKDLIEDERARSGDSVEEILKRVKNPELVKSVTLCDLDPAKLKAKADKFGIAKTCPSLPLRNTCTGVPAATAARGRAPAW